MARHYATRDLFRQMPNALLARYFAGRTVFGEFDFAAMSETRYDELFAAWLAIPESQRNTMDAEFRDIFEMGCEKGFRAIMDEALWHLAQDADPDAYTTFVNKLSAMASRFERATVIFLDYSAFWKGSTRFYHADTPPYWRKRKHPGHQAAVVDAASTDQLATLIPTYFHNTEGRGVGC